MVVAFRNKGDDFSVETMLNKLVARLEHKGHHLEKKYPPLKMIFLVNNIFYIHSKVSQKAFLEKKFLDEEFCDELETKKKGYIAEYLKLS